MTVPIRWSEACLGSQRTLRQEITMRRIASLSLPAVLGLLLLGSIAHADVAPPPDADSPKDMSTMAKPDMTAAINPTNDDDGCSMARRHAGAANGALVAAALGIALSARRRRRA
jgi:hypothetical protein